ncbi:MAG: hypothetical protein LBH00_10090 [Planctomycetaceae bacterium]|jgi:hypothetical protein|nr:hypothetical protein [Planctomycetaceae bacterium]
MKIGLAKWAKRAGYITAGYVGLEIGVAVGLAIGASIGGYIAGVGGAGIGGIIGAVILGGAGMVVGISAVWFVNRYWKKKNGADRDEVDRN